MNGWIMPECRNSGQQKFVFCEISQITDFSNMFYKYCLPKILHSCLKQSFWKDHIWKILNSELQKSVFCKISQITDFLNAILWNHSLVKLVFLHPKMLVMVKPMGKLHCVSL